MFAVTNVKIKSNIYEHLWVGTELRVSAQSTTQLVEATTMETEANLTEFSATLLTKEQAAELIGISVTRFMRLKKKYNVHADELAIQGNKTAIYGLTDIQNMAEELALDDPLVGFRQGLKEIAEGKAIPYSISTNALNDE